MLAYPATFMSLVYLFGVRSGQQIEAPSVASSFYRQIARYIYSLDNENDLSENDELSKYVDSFEKYVERVSAINFSYPTNEPTIEAVLASWERLVELDEKGGFEKACGCWKAMPSAAVGKGRLSDLVLNKDGTGYMTRKGLFVSGNVDVEWEVEEMLGDMAVIVRIPSLKSVAIFTLPDENRMLGMLKSQDSRLNNKIACYQKIS